MRSEEVDEENIAICEKYLDCSKIAHQCLCLCACVCIGACIGVFMCAHAVCKVLEAHGPNESNSGDLASR